MSNQIYLKVFVSYRHVDESYEQKMFHFANRLELNNVYCKIGKEIKDNDTCKVVLFPPEEGYKEIILTMI